MPARASGLTVGVWLQRNTSSADYRGALMLGETGPNTNDENNLQLIARGNGSLELWNANDGLHSSTASNFWVNNEWVYLAFVCNGTTELVYARKESDESMTQILSCPYYAWNDQYLIIGDDTWQEWLVGDVRSCKVWTRELSAAELFTESNSLNSVVNSTNLWAFWPMDGNVLTDSSGNGRDLSRFGGAGTSSADEPTVSSGPEPIEVATTPPSLALASLDGTPEVGAVEQATAPASVALTGLDASPSVTSSVATAPASLALDSLDATPEVGAVELVTVAPELALSALDGVPEVGTQEAATTPPALTLAGFDPSPEVGAVEAATTPAVLALTGLDATSSDAVVTLVPFAKYYLSEASSGQGPTHLLDSGSDPNNLEIVYVGSVPSYTEIASGKGLLFTSQSSPQGAGAYSVPLGPGVKIYDKLEGSTKATITVVAELETISTYNGINPVCLFGIARWDGEYDAFLIWIWDNILWFDWTGSGGDPNSYYARGYALSDVGAGLHSITGVIDTMQANSANRMILYCDGTPLTPVSSEGTPPLGETLHIQTDSSTPDFLPPAGDRYECLLSLGSFDDYFAGNGGFLGRILYADLYDQALTQPQVASAATSLLADNDNFAGFGAQEAATVPADLALSGLAPELELGAIDQATDPGSVSLLGAGPSVEASVVAALASLGLSGVNPASEAGAIESAGQLAPINLLGLSPSVETAVEVETLPANLDLAGLSPSLEIGAVEQDADPASISLFGISVAVETAVAVATAPPSLALSSVLAVVEAVTEVAVSPPGMALTGLGPHVEVSASGVIAGLALSGVTPTVQTFVEVSSTAASLVLVAISPSLEGAAVVATAPPVLALSGADGSTHVRVGASLALARLAVVDAGPETLVETVAPSIALSAIAPSVEGAIAVQTAPAVLTLVAISPSLDGAAQAITVPPVISLRALAGEIESLVQVQTEPASLSLSGLDALQSLASNAQLAPLALSGLNADLEIGAVEGVTTPAFVGLTALDAASESGSEVSTNPGVVSLIALSPTAGASVEVTTEPPALLLSAFDASLSVSSSSSLAGLSLSALPAEVESSGMEVATAPAIVSLSAFDASVEVGEIEVQADPAEIGLQALAGGTFSGTEVASAPAELRLSGLDALGEAGPVEASTESAVIALQAIAAASAVSALAELSVLGLTAVDAVEEAGPTEMDAAPALMALGSVGPEPSVGAIEQAVLPASLALAGLDARGAAVVSVPTAPATVNLTAVGSSVEVGETEASSDLAAIVLQAIEASVASGAVETASVPALIALTSSSGVVEQSVATIPGEISVTPVPVSVAVAIGAAFAPLALSASTTAVFKDDSQVEAFPAVMRLLALDAGKTAGTFFVATEVAPLGISVVDATIVVTPLFSDVLPAQEAPRLRFLNTLSRGDLGIFVRDHRGPLVPAEITYTLHQVRPDGSKFQVGPRNPPVRGRVGEFYVAGRVGALGQPGNWVIRWEFRINFNSPVQVREYPFVVLDAAAESPPATRFRKFGWE